LPSFPDGTGAIPETSSVAIITGTNAPNTLNGTAGADTISGLADADRISGGEGNDVIYGFAGGGLPDNGQINATLVSNGFSRPIFATSAPGDANSLYVVEAHTGQIRILNPSTGVINPTPFLDMSDAEMSRGGEEGLLGLAFHPDYATNGRFFVFITNADGDLEIRSYLRSTGNPDQADPGSGDVILTIPHPGESNHNGGWMGFGPDGYLYISVGDGGGSGDPRNNAQNLNSLLGKMLRIDVDGDDFVGDPDRDYRIPANNPFAGIAGADEIWALGLRNAWRPSFDRLTGDLYIADVGQGNREEVNFQSSASAGGVNYGWKIREGLAGYDGSATPGTPVLTDPVADYGHVSAPNGGFSITGGYVYRGTSPGLQGHYFFADFVTDQLWSIKVVNGVVTEFVNRTAQLAVSGGTVDNISSFAEDGNGNLFIIGLDGEVFRIDPQSSDGADVLSGGNGNDLIRGGSGNDRIDGGADSDTLHGDDGDDTAVGGSGIDSLFGGNGNDRLDGGSEDDRYVGGDAGNDTITGGLGMDRLYGGADADRLLGGDGNDRLFGGTGADRIYGDAGDDIVQGEAGNDYLYGNAGMDRFVFDPGNGADTIYDFTNDVDTLLIGAAFGFTNATGVIAATSQVGAHARIDLGSGNSITLWNYLAANTIASLSNDIAIA
jgi:Ca2+-binding RTX toxin-like protein